MMLQATCSRNRGVVKRVVIAPATTPLDSLGAIRFLDGIAEPRAWECRMDGETLHLTWRPPHYGATTEK